MVQIPKHPKLGDYPPAPIVDECIIAVYFVGFDRSLNVGQSPRNEGRANGSRLGGVTDDLICNGSFGGFGASSHVNIVPILNDIDINLERRNCAYSIYIQCVTWA
jgi:hypothetical protein